MLIIICLSKYKTVCLQKYIYSIFNCFLLHPSDVELIFLSIICHYHALSTLFHTKRFILRASLNRKSVKVLINCGHYCHDRPFNYSNSSNVTFTGQKIVTYSVWATMVLRNIRVTFFMFPKLTCSFTL